jgi:hypothetical protein
MSLFADLGGEVLQRIQEINSLDMELYRFALSLLHQRADQWRTRDPHFQVLLLALVLVLLLALVLVYWYTGILVYWYTGILVYWYTGILVYWYTGILVYWYTGILALFLGLGLGLSLAQIRELVLGLVYWHCFWV